MRILLFCLLSLGVCLTIQSCFFDKKHRNIDSFYISKSFGDMPRVPLLKPLDLTYGQTKGGKTWLMGSLHYFKQRISIDSIFDIGIHKFFIYGKIFERKRYIDNYDAGKFVFVSKYNRVYTTPKLRDTEVDEIRIYPTDSINKTFILPERWFAINVADSTVEAFFSKSKYLDYLKEKGVSGKMYNIDSINKVFRKTGILPWFPDNIKVKLKE
ncbi:MAG: hypothetical protein ACPGTO_05700 [Polaribacter sp.]